MDDTYHGWTNYETWATGLWLGNEEGLYNEVRDIVLSSRDIYEAAGRIKEYVEELRDYADKNEMLKNMFDDIGSLWRVNWVEVAKFFMEE